MSDLSELQRSLGRIEGKIDTFVTQMKVQDERHVELDSRVRKVEGRQHWYAGAGTIVGMIAAWFAKGHQ